MSRRLRILLDARMMLGSFSGVGRVVTCLVDELAQQDGLELLALCGNEPYEPWTRRDDIELLISSFSRADRTAVRRVWWEERHLAPLIRRTQADVFHATWNTGVPPHCSAPAVLTIHDLIPLHEPARHFASWRQRFAYHYSLRRSAKRAALVTTVSHYVRQEVLEHLQLDPERVWAIPNGVNPPASVQPQLERSGRPYVLYVGGHEPRKNLAAVFHALAHYWEHHDSSLELRLTGSVEALCTPARTAYLSLNQPERVTFLGSLDEKELATAYRQAEALLLLSEAEGFGLPALEALAHGCPVVAAARASLPEVVADAGLLVNPDNPAEVAQALARIRSDHSLRESCITRGLSRSRQFTWRAAAAHMRQAYEQAASQVCNASSSPTHAPQTAATHTVGIIPTSTTP